ncbi:MAG: hypothetical protein ACQESR_22990 [Planctomycetota bacterium]
MSSAIVYGVIGLVDPFRAVTALRASGRVLPPIAPALIVACSAMIGVNLLVRPDQVKRYLGQGRGAKALFLP